jgi:hypothetical protein
MILYKFGTRSDCTTMKQPNVKYPPLPLMKDEPAEIGNGQ